MENKDFITEEEINEVTEVETNKKSGLSTPVAMAIGAGLTLLTVSIINKVKKTRAKRKAQAELEAGTIEGTCEDCSDE